MVLFQDVSMHGAKTYTCRVIKPLARGTLSEAVASTL
jgi:hypothetical protein